MFWIILRAMYVYFCFKFNTCNRGGFGGKAPPKGKNGRKKGKSGSSKNDWFQKTFHSDFNFAIDFAMTIQ